MLLSELLEKTDFEILNRGERGDVELSNVFTSDMLSFVMANGQAGAVWVTVMCNPNSVAVAMLTDMPCIVFASGVNVDEITLNKAKDQGLAVLKSKEPVFETAMKIYKMM